jgi:hypothetical protein
MPAIIVTLFEPKPKTVKPDLAEVLYKKIFTTSRLTTTQYLKITCKGYVFLDPEHHLYILLQDTDSFNALHAFPSKSASLPLSCCKCNMHYTYLPFTNEKQY